MPRGVTAHCAVGAQSDVYSCAWGWYRIVRWMLSRAWARGDGPLLTKWVCGHLPGLFSQVGLGQRFQARQTFPEENRGMIVAVPWPRPGGR